MNKRLLGNSDMEIPRVGLGTAPIGSGSDWKIYWGEQDERQAVSAIRAALDAGINWIDTAPFYGWGRSERLVGKAVAGRREQVYLFTKCGTLSDGRGHWVDDLRPETIHREVNDSLRRMGTDYVDLLQFHSPDAGTPVEASWEAAHRLVEAGKVRWCGLSNFTTELMERARRIAPITSNQHQFCPLVRDPCEEILPYSAAHGIGFLSWGTLASGFLADKFSLDALEPGDFRRKSPWAAPAALHRIDRVRDSFREIASSRGRPLVDVVCAWNLHQVGVTAAIIGARTAQEAAMLAGGASLELSEDELAVINEFLKKHEF